MTVKPFDLVRTLRVSIGLFIVIALLAFIASPRATGQSTDDPDAIIVGTGVAGLSAALELARGGAHVQVVDMWSVFGGHAVMSTGGLSIVGSETQKQHGITDTPEIAIRDFHEWGEGADPHWVEFYVRNSNKMIGEWLADIGVTWDGVTRPPGNSVPRFHLTSGRGLGLVGPIYREVLKYPNVKFRWNFRVTELLKRGDRVIGISGEDMRSGAADTMLADNVLLATGGFQSNLEMVLDNWPADLPKPETLLVGSGLNSMGSGHRIAAEAGAAFHRMDYQWNYATGQLHPAYPGEGRALSTSVDDAIWVNAQAQRFVNETGSVKEQFPAVVRQRPATYWEIFDEDGKQSAFVSGSGWQDFELVEARILNNPELTTRADTIGELAAQIGLDADALTSTVDRFNDMLERGVDEDFGRFDSDDEIPADAKISVGPFFAMQKYPMTRKSMGGIRIDHGGRVLNDSDEMIPGLLAAGEATGMAGVNGSAGLEGTFLGPSLVTGRVAAQTVLADAGARSSLDKPTRRRPDIGRPAGIESAAGEPECIQCHDVPTLLSIDRSGYDHFERVHRLVQEQQQDCKTCHSDMTPLDLTAHRIDRYAQVDVCQRCHLAVEYAE